MTNTRTRWSRGCLWRDLSQQTPHDRVVSPAWSVWLTNTVRTVSMPHFTFSAVLEPFLSPSPPFPPLSTLFLTTFPSFRSYKLFHSHLKWISLSVPLSFFSFAPSLSPPSSTPVLPLPIPCPSFCPYFLPLPPLPSPPSLFSGSRCPCGEYCNNKRFQRGVYAQVEVFKTDKKGWGLRALTDIPQWVILHRSSMMSR